MSKETSYQVNRTHIPALSKGSTPADSSYESSSNAQTLFEWLGSFWSEVYEDPEFIQDLQEGRALRIAQLYLDLLENLKLQDRENAPVFHRERWHPIVLHRSQRNTGSSCMVKLSSETVEDANGEQQPVINLGVQKSDIYPEGTTITLGGKDANYSGMVVYPLDEASSKLIGVSTCITNSIANAEVVLGSGTNFMVLDGAIAFAESQDPFTGENADKFPKFEIVSENPNEDDVETVLWACDAMFDRNFIYTALGYAMRLPTGSSEVYKRVVNATWNITASGATPLLIRALMASICGIPTVKTEGEVVETILDEMDGSIDVVTDRNVYALPKGSELRKNVRRGAVLHRFDTLDKAIRVYACATDAQRLPEYNDFLDDFDEFTEDVPALDLPPAMFRSDVDRGFSVNWELQDVVYCGKDANDNPKLRFSLGGSKSDEDRFWSDTWESYEREGKSMETCLEGLRYDRIYDVGAVWAKISPMEFFMHNLVGANTLIITVRTDTLAEDAPLYDPRFFGVLRESIPSYIRLYVIEHSAAPEEKYQTTDISDDGEMYAIEECEEKIKYADRRHGPKYRDRVSSKWVASCGKGGEYGRDEYDE